MQIPSYLSGGALGANGGFSGTLNAVHKAAQRSYMLLYQAL